MVQASDATVFDYNGGFYVNSNAERRAHNPAAHDAAALMLIGPEPGAYALSHKQHAHAVPNDDAVANVPSDIRLSRRLHARKG